MNWSPTNWLRRTPRLRRRTDFPLTPSFDYFVNARRLDEVTTQLEEVVQSLQNQRLGNDS